MTPHDGEAGSSGRRLKAAKPQSSGARAVLLLMGAALVAGCEVTNPGPVQDEFLNDDGSHAALVRGAERRVMDALGRHAYSGVAAATREVFPGGDSNSMPPLVQAGRLPEGSGDWNNLMQARFIAEDALRRFALPDVDAEPKNVAQAHIWAGYALRILGENYCQVVIDGGPLEQPAVALTRAEGHFTQAIALAANDVQRNAAYAGRAQVRLALRNWAGAASDAAEVPIDFRFNVTPDPAQEPARNYAGYYNDNTPYRVFTMKHTFFEDYYTDTGDPRVPWREVAGFPYSGSRLTGYTQTVDNRVPWLQLMQEGGERHYGPGTPISLARGPEMLLVRAEAILVQTPANWVAALALINQARTHYVSLSTGDPLEEWTAGSTEETWTVLKTERFIEGFLQAKRLHDIRRWTADNRPGVTPWPDWTGLSSIFGANSAYSSQGICFVVPNNERLANPNIPDDLVS